MSNIGDIYGKVINGVNSLVMDSSNLNVNANLNINGIIALNDITNTNITNASLYGTQGQVLTCGTDACGNLGLPFWSDGASGSGSGSGLHTSVYIAADANNTSPASDGFITYLPSPITKNSTFNNNAFSPGRIGDYKVTSNLTFTGGSATVRIVKPDSSLRTVTSSSNPISNFLQRSYDFRNVTATTYSTTSSLTFTDSIDSATVTLESGSATFSSGSGYQGASNHYINLTASDWTFPSAFSIELFFKLGANSEYHSVFDAYDSATSRRIALMRNSTNTNSLALWIDNASSGVGFTFPINESQFEHVILRFNGTDVPQAYLNGAAVTLTTYHGNWGTSLTSASTGTKNNVILGRNAYHPTYYSDNGTEEIKLVAWYNTAVTAEQAMQLYEHHSLEVDVLGKSSGSGTVITQAIAQQLATTDSIKVHAEGSFTGYSGDAALIVENVDGGLQGQQGLGFPDISGTSGQILMLDNSNPPEAIWSNPVNKHGHATYLTNEGGLNYDYLNYISIIPVNGGAGSTGLSNMSDVTDTGYTSLTGMEVTYNPIGVTFVPSTTAMTTANGTVTFSNNPSSLPPSRWRINTTGHYRVKACAMVVDNNPGYRSQIYLWRRSGGNAQYAGTTVTLIGLQSTLQHTGSSEDLGMSVEVEGIYSLSEFDEIYCSVNGDTTSKYQAYLGTYFTIESVDGIQGPQGPAGTGFPSITGTSGQVLTLDSSNPPQAVWTDGLPTGGSAGQLLVNGGSNADSWGNLVFNQQTNHNVITLASNTSSNPLVIENAFSTTTPNSSTLENSIVLKAKNSGVCVRVFDDVIDAMTYTANSNSASGRGLYLNWASGGTVFTPNGSVSSSSDDRIKFDEQDITNGLSLMRQLRPQKYTKRRPGETGRHEWGFIAQHVELISDVAFAVTQPDKEWIEGDPNTCYKYIDYQPLYIAAIAAIKELDAQVQQLTARIQALETPQ